MIEEVILFPSYQQALAYRKRVSLENPKASFGLHAETLESWLTDAWERFGDGRRIVSALQRELILYQLIKTSDELSAVFEVEDLSFVEEASFLDGLVASSYTESHSYLGSIAKCAASFILSTAGSLELTSALQNAPEALSARELGMLNLASQYFTFLELHNAIELGSAACALMKTTYACHISLGQQFDFPYGVEQSLVMAGSLAFAENTEVRIGKLPKGVAAGFVFPAGPSAEDAALVQAITDYSSSKEDVSILVVSAHPFRAFSSFAQGLNLAEVTVCLSAHKAFFLTDFGRVYHALFDFILNSEHSTRALQDYFDSPFSGVDRDKANKVDSLMRGKRTLSYDELHALAGLYSPHFEEFEKLYSSTDASEVLDYFEDVVLNIPGVDGAYRAEQMSSINALRAIYNQARPFTSEPADIVVLLESVSIPVESCIGTGSTYIKVADAGNAELHAAQPYHAVFVCDLDSKNYPASSEHSAATTLRQKIGIPIVDTSIAQKRRWFEALKSCATDLFVCERLLSGGDSDDIYPSFLLNEYLAGYTEEGKKLDALGLPSSLSDFVFTRNEDNFTANISCMAVSADAVASTPIAVPYLLSDDERKNLFPSYMLATDRKLILSPSAIEAYINCPYCWFVSQRLRPEPCDEGFGPLERGTFAHAVLERFYPYFQQQTGYDRVSPENLAIAQRLFGNVFDEVLSEQAALDGVRYVPQSPTEIVEAKRLKIAMTENLALQADFLPGFVPAAQEISIHSADQVSYAGVYLRGRVDRVDINHDAAQFAVVDYKGSITGHNAGLTEKDFCELGDSELLPLPHKIQALIYAQALKQKMSDLHPVGSLYINYRTSDSKAFLGGSLSSLLAESYPVSKSVQVSIGFTSFLDAIEAAVEKRLAGLYEGCITPDPLDKESCSYCVVPNCPRRLS